MAALSEARGARPIRTVVFDWDGTAVPDRAADASAVRSRVERLCEFGVDVVVVSGTNVDNVDGQLGARPGGPGRLFVCANRGSEVFAVGEDGPFPVWRRTATDQEEARLSAAAELLRDDLARRGIDADIVYDRLNRRKVDLSPIGPTRGRPSSPSCWNAWRVGSRRPSWSGWPGSWTWRRSRPPRPGCRTPG